MCGAGLELGVGAGAGTGAGPDGLAWLGLGMRLGPASRRWPAIWPFRSPAMVTTTTTMATTTAATTAAPCAAARFLPSQRGVPCTDDGPAAGYADTGRPVNARRSTGGDYASAEPHRYRPRCARPVGEPQRERLPSSFGAGRSVTSRNDGWGEVRDEPFANRTTAVNRRSAGMRRPARIATRSLGAPGRRRARPPTPAVPPAPARRRPAAAPPAGNACSPATARRRHRQPRVQLLVVREQCSSTGSRAYSSRSAGSSNAAGSPAYSWQKSLVRHLDLFRAGGAARDRLHRAARRTATGRSRPAVRPAAALYSGGGYLGSRSYGNRSYKGAFGRTFLQWRLPQLFRRRPRSYGWRLPQLFGWRLPQLFGWRIPRRFFRRWFLSPGGGPRRGRR